MSHQQQFTSLQVAGPRSISIWTVAFHTLARRASEGKRAGTKDPRHVNVGSGTSNVFLSLNNCVALLLLAILLGSDLQATAQAPPKPIPLAEAAKKVDQEVTIEFEVKSSGGVRNCYLNSAPDFSQASNFTVFIPQAVRNKFTAAKIDKPEEYFYGRKIQVTGKVILVRDKPQIVIQTPSQITVTNPDAPRIYKTKAKNAQEAHEAIRPTSLARNPGSLRLESDLGRLYELIWKRMIASQMESARIERTTVDLESADGKTGLRATGQVVLFPGYLAVYEEGRDDEADEDGGRLPIINEGAEARVIEARADQLARQILG